MEKISVSKFKATCLSLLEHVRKTGQPILITKRGDPIAQVNPPPLPLETENNSFGCMLDTAIQIGDIVESFDTNDWEVLK